MNYKLVAKRLRAMAEELEGEDWFAKLEAEFPVKEKESKIFGKIAVTSPDEHYPIFATSQKGKELFEKYARSIARTWNAIDENEYDSTDQYPEDYFFTVENQRKDAIRNDGFSHVDSSECNFSDKYVVIFEAETLYCFSFNSKEELKKIISE